MLAYLAHHEVNSFTFLGLAIPPNVQESVIIDHCASTENRGGFSVTLNDALITE